jgi:hypothetical protein
MKVSHSEQYDVLLDDDERLWDQPEDEIPEVPRDITGTDDRDLMQIFARYVAWENFIAEELVRAEIEETRAESAHKIAEARFLAGYESSRKSGVVTEAKAAAKLDTAVGRAEQRRIMAYAKRKVLAVQQDSLQRTSAFLSRELSRRIGRDPVERRNARLNP